MFTGIITHTGRISAIEKKGDWKLTITAPDIMANLAIGASVAVSGVCLTVTTKSKSGFGVQVSKETLSCTTLAGWKKGTIVNLERALKVGDELGGHFVSGHVNGVVVLRKKKKVKDSYKLSFAAPKGLRRFLAPKGSVTLDGVSLTVNEVTGKGFSVNIIPHTQKATIIGSYKAGNKVNLEVDLIIRHCARLLSEL